MGQRELRGWAAPQRADGWLLPTGACQPTGPTWSQTSPSLRTRDRSHWDLGPGLGLGFTLAKPFHTCSLRSSAVTREAHPPAFPQDCSTRSGKGHAGLRPRLTHCPVRG